jgi:predicted dehydrogenase
MQKQVRWGLMAPGGIAHTIARDFKLAGIEFQAVGSRSSERAEAFAAEHGIAKSYGSYQELVADGDIDVIYIASPHSEHFANGKLALEGGKHILVEKPFTINAAQARELAALAESRGLFAMEAMWTRFLPHMVRIRELLAEGALGEIVAVEASHNQSLPAERHPRLHDLALGGGATLDLGVYPIAFAVDVLGVPERVTALGRLSQTGVDESVAASLSYRSGAVASLQTTLLSKAATTASISGTLGSIQISQNFYELAEFRRYDANYQLVEHFTERAPGRGMQLQAVEVERCLAANKLESELMPLSDTIAVAEIMDEIRDQIGLRYPGE